jgi:hypothetical protein
MDRLRCWRGLGTALLALAGLVACGCQLFPGRAAHPGQLGTSFPGAPGILGALVDPPLETQELNAEASDFVVYDHEFIGDGVRLNDDGEDHLKQIAARVRNGSSFAVIVERSFSSPDPDDSYQFPIHPNPELDLRRRLVVVRALQAMSVPDAEDRVVVGPALATPMDFHDVRRAHMNIDTRMGLGMGGMGGMGGFGGFGGFGFF